MNIKTYRGFFWTCILVSILCNAVFYFIENFCIPRFQPVYDPITWVACETVQMLLTIALGIFIRKNRNHAILENDGTEEKYIKYIHIWIVFLIILFFLPDTFIMFHYYTDKIISAITAIIGLRPVGFSNFFNYIDLWDIAICLGCVFFKINHKKKCIE